MVLGHPGMRAARAGLGSCSGFWGYEAWFGVLPWCGDYEALLGVLPRVEAASLGLQPYSALFVTVQ